MRWWPWSHGRRSQPFFSGGKWWAWKTDHGFEERLLELTDDYRFDAEHFLPPEIVAPEPEEDRLSLWR